MTISPDQLAGILITAFIAVVGYLLQAKLRKVEKVDDILVELRGMSQALSQNTQIISELRPKLEQLAVMQREITAAWRTIEELKSTVSVIRDREHKLANWITVIRGKCEKHCGETFKTDWQLPPIEGDK